MRQLPRVATAGNFGRMILIAAICFLYFFCTSCSPRYTEGQARKLFGCKTDSVSSDSNTTHQRDTFTKYITIPADTIKVQSPCEEIAKMQPGEKKTQKSKSGRTVSEHGKDSAGQSYFKCFAQEYKDSMEWYRDTWRTTVNKTVYQSNPTVESTRWQVFQDMAKNVMSIIGLIAVALLIIKFRSQ